MPGNISAAIQHIAIINDQKTKIEQYKQLLSAVISTNNVEDAKAFVDHSKLASRLEYNNYKLFPVPIRPCPDHTSSIS